MSNNATLTGCFLRNMIYVLTWGIRERLQIRKSWNVKYLHQPAASTSSHSILS
jgi:hypothetical protein